LLLVLALLRGFSFGYAGFPPSIKKNIISKFQFDLDRGPAKADVAFPLNIVQFFFLLLH